MTPEILGALTSLGTVAVSKLIDNMTSSSDDSSNTVAPVQVVTKPEKPSNVVINLNFYIDGEAVKKFKLMQKEQKFIDEMKSLKAIEYVILHELNHLKFPHHQREFYENLQKLMPDFRQRELEFKLR